MKPFKVILSTKKGGWVFVLGILRPDITTSDEAEAHAREFVFTTTGRTNINAQVVEVPVHIGSTFPVAA
jgi:hypothetical protein